jgi:hypothetical protein
MDTAPGSASLAASRWLAVVFGVLTPLAETVRRWGTWWDHPAAYVDDLLLGGFLLLGAWASAQRHRHALLAAAWGFACGMAYSSIAAHWFAMRAGQSDPAPIPTQWVFGIKLVGGCIFALALFLTLRGSRNITHSLLPTAAGEPGADVPIGTPRSALKQAGLLDRKE